MKSSLLTRLVRVGDRCEGWRAVAVATLALLVLHAYGVWPLGAVPAGVRLLLAFLSAPFAYVAGNAACGWMRVLRMGRSFRRSQ